MDMTRILRRYFREIFGEEELTTVEPPTGPASVTTGITTTPLVPSALPTAVALPTATPTAPNTPSMTGSLEMQIGSMNVKNSLSDKDVIKCGAIAAVQGAGIYGCQEIKQEHHRPLANGFGPNYVDLHPNIQIPIFVDRTRFTTLNAGNALMHEGLANASPNRYISWGRFKSIQNPGMPPFIVMNTHMAVQKDNALKAKNWRIRMWEVHLAKMAEKIREWDKELVFITGDFNPDHRPVNLPNVKWVSVHDPDRIGVKSPATIKAAFVNDKTFATPSDHNGIIARFMVRGNK